VCNINMHIFGSKLRKYLHLYKNLHIYVTLVRATGNVFKVSVLSLVSAVAILLLNS
jgi:hypothetical protein